MTYCPLRLPGLSYQQRTCEQQTWPSHHRSPCTARMHTPQHETYLQCTCIGACGHQPQLTCLQEAEKLAVRAPQSRFQILQIWGHRGVLRDLSTMRHIPNPLFFKNVWWNCPSGCLQRASQGIADMAKARILMMSSQRDLALIDGSASPKPEQPVAIECLR